MFNSIWSRTASLFSAFFLFSLLAACGGGGSGSSSSSSSTTTTTPPVPTLTLTGSATAVSASTAATLTATLKDGNGNPLSGVVVTFKTAGTTFGVFSPSGATALTGSNGVATITLNAGTATGADSVTATASVNGATVTSNAFGFTSTGTTTASVVASVSLASTATSVASDNSGSVTISAIVVDSSNAALPGVTVAFAADTGVLSAASAVTDATGKASVTFSSGTSNPATRTATITATASGKSSQIPIRISGASLTATTSTSSLIVSGVAANLTFTLKNASGGALANQTVTLTSSGAGGVTLSPASGTTDANGLFTATATGTVGGTVTITATAAGETRTLTLTVTGPSVAFQILTPSADPSTNAATLGGSVLVTVQAPSPTTSVTFVSTLGTFDGTGSNTVTKTVTGGTVSATLVSNAAGVATIQVYDTARQATLTASRLVSYTASAASAYRITLQSTPSVVAPSSGTAGLSTLGATVTDVAGNPVGNASVAFSIVNPTGGGETINPAVILTSGVATSTSTLGQASTTFTSGSLPSGATGIQIRAKVVGSAVVTNTSPSGNDATVVIGGTAGSVTIGRSTVISDTASSTVYTLPMSVLVADSNGNPVPNTSVSLSSWPIAFNVSGACSANLNPDGITSPDDYLNEDDIFPSDSTKFENLSLNPGEDGARVHYWSGVAVAGGTVDGQLTPPNSASGTLPSTVTTNASGVATFNLTYTKSNALHILARITARTFVLGTETKGQIVFRLPALVTDIGPPCLLPASPYVF